MEGCHGGSRTRAGLRNHFCRRHWNDTVHIVEEHPEPYPKCHLCDLHVPFRLLNERHYNTDQCRAGAARKQQREAALKGYYASSQEFLLNGQRLESVNNFLYLGRVLSFTNNDWPALYRNLKKARQRWSMIVRILDKDGSTPRAKGLFYKTIAMAVLLYGCETWTLTDTMIKVLEGFHHRVARRITGKMPYLEGDDWIYPPLVDAMEEAGLFTIGHYVHKRQTTIALHIATRPIYQLIQQATPRTGSPRTLRWWEQDHSPDPDFDPAQLSSSTDTDPAVSWPSASSVSDSSLSN